MDSDPPPSCQSTLLACQRWEWAKTLSNAKATPASSFSVVVAKQRGIPQPDGSYTSTCSDLPSFPPLPSLASLPAPSPSSPSPAPTPPSTQPTIAAAPSALAPSTAHPDWILCKKIQCQFPWQTILPLLVLQLGLDSSLPCLPAVLSTCTPTGGMHVTIIPWSILRQQQKGLHFFHTLYVQRF